MLLAGCQPLITCAHSDACRYNPTGFIVNDVAVEGPLLCMGDLYTMWAVESLSDVTPQTLSMLHLTKPTPGKHCLPLLAPHLFISLTSQSRPAPGD